MSGLIVQTRPNVGFAFEQLTVAGTVQVLTPSKYKDSATSGGASSAFLTNETASIRYTYDGTTPSATVGHLLTDGGTLVLMGQQQMASFKCIRVSGVSATITVTYERE
jgi:hypothetical protein